MYLPRTGRTLIDDVIAQDRTGASGVDAEFQRVVGLGEDFARLRGARESFVDLGAFHYVANLAPAGPGAQQQNRYGPRRARLAVLRDSVAGRLEQKAWRIHLG